MYIYSSSERSGSLQSGCNSAIGTRSASPSSRHPILPYVYPHITKRPHTTYVSWYYCIQAHHRAPGTSYTICVFILLYVCPHTTIYVSSDYYICVLILLYMCPHTTIYVSSFYCIEAHHGAAGTRFTCFTSTTEQSLTPKELLCVEQVLSLLALLVPKYKYWHLTALA